MKTAIAGLCTALAVLLGAGPEGWAQKAAKAVVRLNGKARPMESVALNGRVYATMQQLAAGVGARALNNFQLVRGADTLTAITASFFVSASNGRCTRLVQMPYPVIYYQSKVLVPVAPFLRAGELMGYWQAAFLGSGQYSVQYVQSEVRTLVCGEDVWEEKPPVRPMAPEVDTVRGGIVASAAAEPSPAPQEEEQPSFGSPRPFTLDDDGAEWPAEGVPTEGMPAEEVRGSKDAPAAEPKYPPAEEESMRRPQPVPESATAAKQRVLPAEPKSAPPAEDTTPKSLWELDTNYNRQPQYVLPSGLKRLEMEEGRHRELPPAPASRRGDGYILPPGLRRSVPDTLSEAVHSGSALLAYDGDDMWALAGGKSALSDVSVRNAEGGIEIRVDAAGAIEDYQKPELSGRSVILRFSGLSDATGGVSALAKHPAIRSAKLTSYRGTLILTVTLRKAPQAVRHRRLSASSVVFTVSGAEGGESVAATRTEQVQSAGQAEAADSGAARGGDKQAEKWKLDVVVLDAGHGGQDVGAIGLSGVYEKNITLAVTKKVAALLRKRRPEMKVVLTRSDDTFVELYRRTQIANEAGGKLFISLHCNSMPKKPHPAHGFEVYILRPGRDEDAARVADKENASVKFEKGSKAKYKALTREQFIVVTMAQKAFVKFSEMVGKELTRAAARATPLANRGINQAGFFVLVGASMPNVLVEMGFLSNAKDEEYLRSERGQNEIAESLVEGILNYEEQYDRSLRVGQD